MVAERPKRNCALSQWKPLAIVLIGAMSVGTAGAQSAKTPSKSTAGAQKSHTKAHSKAAAALASEPLAATPAPPPPPPKPLAPEKMPPQVPQVAWDGKLLTINADNSTLSDILVAVRMLTGADVDVPPEASRERIAARLGPAPPREVLSTLLSWTNFDFVIQASESDPAGLKNIILTPRSKSDTVVAGNTNNASESTRSAFFSRANGRKNVPAPAENSEPAQENPTPASSETAESAPQPEPPPASEKAQTDAANAAAAQPKPAADGASTGAAAPAVAADSQTSAPQPVATSATSADSSSKPANPMDNKIQQMQSMFEQRKQMIMDSRKQGQSQ
jgi:hypothetical protein